MVNCSYRSAILRPDLPAGEQPRNSFGELRKRDIQLSVTAASGGTHIGQEERDEVLSDALVLD